MIQMISSKNNEKKTELILNEFICQICQTKFNCPRYNKHTGNCLKLKPGDKGYIQKIITPEDWELIKQNFINTCKNDKRTWEEILQQHGVK